MDNHFFTQNKQKLFNLEKLWWLSGISDARSLPLQVCMPLQLLYTMVLDHDIKVGSLAIETAGALQLREYYQVLYFLLRSDSLISLVSWVTEGPINLLGARCSDLAERKGKEIPTQFLGKGSYFQQCSIQGVLVSDVTNLAAKIHTVLKPCLSPPSHEQYPYGTSMVREPEKPAQVESAMPFLLVNYTHLIWSCGEATNTGPFYNPSPEQNLLWPILDILPCMWRVFLLCWTGRMSASCARIIPFIWWSSTLQGFQAYLCVTTH